MRTTDFDFELPSDLIAQVPSERRDESRLMVFCRSTGHVEHRRFAEFPDYLKSGDLLVLNNSRVIPARLRGTKLDSGGEVELLLVEENRTNDWWAMVRPGKRVRRGSHIVLSGSVEQPVGIRAVVLDKSPEGHVRLGFTGTPDLQKELDSLGEIPLPPYILRERPVVAALDRERYQTVYAALPGSVAAPTAGLHFTQSLLEQIRHRGVEIHHVTLHIGLGTFAPVRTLEVKDHPMHEERFDVPSETAQAINGAKRQGRRVVAVGTTTARVLEAVALANQGRLVAGPGRTRIFMYPPHEFRITDALLTNFHLPCSTLLMLVSAFATPTETRGRELMLKAYAEAIRERYRFFSYGDAMFLR